MTPAEQAALFYFLLPAGLASCDEIIAWADRRIVEEAKPEFTLIELSTASPGDARTIISSLGILKGDVSDADALRMALPRIKEKIEAQAISPEKAAGLIYRYMSERFATLPKDLLSLYSVDDDFYCRIAAGGTRDDVVRDFLALLEQLSTPIQALDPTRVSRPAIGKDSED